MYLVLGMFSPGGFGGVLSLGDVLSPGGCTLGGVVLGCT